MRTVCGLDVHKDSVFACILNEKGEKKENVYGVLTPHLHQLHDDLALEGVTDITMESTSIYWVPLRNILHPDFEIWVTNAQFVKQVPGRKKDQSDACWLAVLLLNNLVSKSYIPSAITLELRNYERRYVDLRKKSVRISTQTDNLLQRCNMRLSNYVSNISTCKSYKKVITQLLQGETDPDKLLLQVHGRIRNKHGKETIRAALMGKFSVSDLALLKQYQREKEFIESLKTECLSAMKEIADMYFPKEMDLLQTLPGVKETGAMCIIAELGTDMTPFRNAASLVGWAGLKPRNDESAGKIKSRKILKGNKYLRATLLEVAWSSSRTKGSRFKQKFDYLMGRHMKEQKAIVAIARKMLVVIWNILYKKEPFDPNRHLSKRPKKPDCATQVA